MDWWRQLDLRSKESCPRIGALVALCLVPNNNRATFYNSEKYDIGRFKQPDKNRKYWWYGTRGTDDPARLKQHYDIFWCYVTPYNDKI